ncbi:MAG: hypothetical protein M3Q08_02045 [Pseudomonadota bacterium]|nr:hypothetical protein [Pseudomonadota bacterium]
MKHLIAPAFLLAASCATTPAASGEDRFFQRLSSLCGKAFEGRIASPPAEGDAAFAGKRLVMHVRHCSPGEIRIPFQVGEDRSRTWVITKTAGGLRLKHDHRHRDGSEDKLTQYGGDSVQHGSRTDRQGASRQEFPADAYSTGLFTRENLPQSAANIWALEVHPERMFGYELRRPGRFFRVEFDLSRPVASPPPPWGSR